MLKNFNEVKSIVIDCYRKFKSHVYYSNNLQFLRLKIADFEKNRYSMNESFDRISRMIIAESNVDWTSLLGAVSYRVLPKISVSNNHNTQIISNKSSFEDLKIEKVNFFIDAPIEVYIIDTLWTVLIGKLVVEKQLFHGEVCANRLNANIYNSKEKDIIKSIDFKNLSIYYPYFKGYKSWKNCAVFKLEQLYDSGHDGTLVSLDLTSYFYSVNVDFEAVRDLLTSDKDNRYDEFSFLTQSIKSLYIYYSKLIKTFRTDISDEQTIIPIGLISSGVISNLYLHDFDMKIKSKDSVVYYSRYVDDLLLVINKAFEDDTLMSIMKEYFDDCLEYADSKIKVSGFPGLTIQSEKIKIIKLFASQSKNYINILKEEITNTSEPQLLPSVDVDLKKFISNAYIHNDNSLKLREMDALNINTLNVMRFIGSYLRSKKNTREEYDTLKKRRSKLSYYERVDQETQEQLKIFFKGSILFSLYLKWDRIFCFAILYNNDFSLAKSIYDDILENIERIDSNFDFVKKRSQKTINKELKKTLKLHLKVCFSMALAIRYESKLYRGSFKTNNGLLNATLSIRNANMFDNSLVEFPMINYFEPTNNKHSVYSGLSYNEYIKRLNGKNIDLFAVKYLPRFIHFQEYCLCRSILRIDEINTESFLNGVYQDYQSILDYFSSHFNKLVLNITTSTKTQNANYIISEISARSPYNGYSQKYADSAVYLALANINLDKHKMFKHGRFNFSQCTFERKSELYKLLNEAYVFVRKKNSVRDGLIYGQQSETRKQKVKFLAFPEVSVPLEWLENIAKFVRITGTAVICGIKHFLKDNKIYNCVATVIPVGNEVGRYHNALVVLREKNDYSPEEISLIENNGYIYQPKVQSYNCIFNWDNINFAVFDCYELTDIYARAIMKSKLDILFAPEYNKDINYFSNIVESASRDIYCFVAQINTSNYGDTKIIAPYKTELKCVVNIKGGERDSIHIGSVDIEEFREYQRFEGSAEYKCWAEERRQVQKKLDDKKENSNNRFAKYKKTSARHKK